MYANREYNKDRNLFQKLKSWLKPQASFCLYCRTAPSLSSAASLCKGCLRKIPWITRIHCTRCGRYETCDDCRRQTHHELQGNRSAVKYNDEMKQWLARFKYRGDERLLPVLAEMMMHAYNLVLRDFRLNQHDFVAITYIPLSRERLLERGFNQAELLAKALAERVGLPLVPLLLRPYHSEKQSMMTRRERLLSLQSAFTIDEQMLSVLQEQLKQKTAKQKNLLIVDDVYTTGNTLHQAARMLQRALPATYVGVTWARA